MGLNVKGVFYREQFLLGFLILSYPLTLNDSHCRVRTHVKLHRITTYGPL